MVRSRRWTLSRNRLIKLCLLLVIALSFMLRCFHTFFVSPTLQTSQILAADSQNSSLAELHDLIQQALHIALTRTNLKNIYNSSRPKAVTHTELQVFLGCLSHLGTVSEDGLNPSDVSSNSDASAGCGGISSIIPFSDPWDISMLCRRLIGMKILIVGSHMTYKLHNTLLDILPSGSHGSQFHCHGPALCTWHEICSAVVPQTHTLFSPSERRRLPPHDLSNSAIMRFSMSSTLCPSDPDEANPQPYVSSLTGVREHNAKDWLEKAQRSDMVILSKSPVPAPAWSYTSDRSSVQARFNVRIPSPGSPEWVRMEPFTSLLVPRGVLRDLGVIGAAWRATMVKWLPELIDTLVCLRTGHAAAAAAGERLLVWLGSSFGTGCASREELAKIRDNQTNIPWFLDCVGCDDRCTFENVQVYIQNMILDQILPSLGMLYIREGNPSPSRSRATSTSPGTPLFMDNQQVNISVLENTTKTADADSSVFLLGLIAILRWRDMAHDVEEV